MTDTTLTFHVGQTETGEYLAVREHEPLFCFYASSEEEAVDYARATIQDYRERFQGQHTRLRAHAVNPLPRRRFTSGRAYALEEVA